MSNVFISYSRSDAAIAERLASALRSTGFSVWIDTRDIGPGRPFDREIEQAIVGAACVIVLWTAQAVESNWVRGEAQLASGANKLIPLQLEAVNPPINLRQLQTIDFRDWDGSTTAVCFEKLRVAVSNFTGVTPAAAERLAKSPPSELRVMLERAGLLFADTDSEKRFGLFYADRYYGRLRTAFIAITIAYILFDIGDMMNRFGSVDSNVFRSLIGAPLLLALVAVGYLNIARRYWRALALTFVAVALAVLIITLNSQNLTPNPPPFKGTYHFFGAAVAATFLLAACFITILPLRVPEAIAAGLAIIAMTYGLDYLVNTLEYDHYLAQSQAIGAAGAIIVGAWLRERSARRWFREASN